MRPARRDLALAVLGAIAVPALVTPYLLALGYRLDGPPVSVWVPLAALGVTVAVAVARYRLVTPALVVLGVTAVAAYDAWRFVASPAAGAGPTLLALVFVGWFAPLAGALLAGAVEYRLRGALGARFGA